MMYDKIFYFQISRKQTTTLTFLADKLQFMYDKITTRKDILLIEQILGTFGMGREVLIEVKTISRLFQGYLIPLQHISRYDELTVVSLIMVRTIAISSLSDTSRRP